MKKLLILALLSLPLAAFSQELSNAELEDMPAAKGAKTEALESAEPVQRPDAQKIMSELSTALRLSSKQEERLTSAINKRMAQFDKLMKEYDKNSAEEKKWRYKMNANRYEMLKLNREMPDAIREFLDDDQRQNYDGLEAAKRKPAPRPEAPAVEPARPLDWDGSVKPLKKKRVLRRKKIRASAPAAPATVSGAAEEEAGQVMVDRDPAAARPAPRKRRVLKKKARVAEPPVEDIMVDEPAGAQSTGREAPAEEDAGSYP